MTEAHPKKTCPTCRGRGVVYELRDYMSGDRLGHEHILCPSCDGRGRVDAVQEPVELLPDTPIEF